MPRAEFGGECPTHLGIPELVEMKRRWRCSMVAILRRAHAVGRISDQNYTGMMKTISYKGWRKQEPHPITGESPTRLAASVQQAIDAGFSEEALADRIGIRVARLRAWRQPFPGQRLSLDAHGPTLRLVDGF